MWNNSENLDLYMSQQKIAMVVQIFLSVSLLLWLSGDNLWHVCIPMIVHFLRGWFIDN